MKTLRCPLCGGSFELFEEGANIYLYQCLDCPLASSVSYTEKGALENAKELISKFPPIMRLGQGDNVMVRFSDDTHTVLYTNVDRGKIYLQDVYGNALPYDVDEIKQWPWELEQKGGQQ